MFVVLFLYAAYKHELHVCDMIHICKYHSTAQLFQIQLKPDCYMLECFSITNKY